MGASFVCTSSQRMFLPDGFYCLAAVSAPSSVGFFSSTSARSRPGSDYKSLASEVCCIHLGQEQCFEHLLTAVGHDCSEI